MDQSTPIVKPAAALEIWAGLLPNPPGTVAALLARSRNGTGPPGTVVYHKKRPEGTPPAETMYDPALVREWCLGQQPVQVQAAIAALEFLRCPTADGLAALAQFGPVANVEPALHRAILQCLETDETDGGDP